MGRSAGAPVIVDDLVPGLLYFSVLLFFPAAADVLAKCAAPGASGFAAFAVVGDELGYTRFDKVVAHPVEAGEVLHGGGVGAPIGTNKLASGNGLGGGAAARCRFGPC